MRYLYRWHLDETALLTIDDSPQIELRFRQRNVPLDEGDKSQYCELLVPQLQVRMLLKKADYEIPEMNLRINNEGFRIQQVERYEEPGAPRQAYETVQLPKKKIIEHLFATRNNSEYPDAVMMERMRKALREQWDVSGRPRPSEPQRCYVAPISPVSNDLWIYWESGGMVFRFTSDSDLNSAAYWDCEKMKARIYDLREQVVVSLAEAAGSNAFVTRDWAARVLFNCIVHGERLTIIPEENLNKPIQIQQTPVP
jgi:hypothetical protein